MKTLCLALILTLSFSSFARTSEFLIKEMEALRDSLSMDDPARMDLTMRLADLYFDISIQEGKKEEVEFNRQNRLKSLELYKTSLLVNNKKSSEKENSKENLRKAKILFQMARLYTRLDEGKMAEPNYLEILNSSAATKKMKEQSALALAEWYEEETKYDQAKRNYDLAVGYCEDRDSCNYANYRLGWLLFKDTKLNEAIAAMEKSLWTKEGILRENSITDYLLFISNADTDGKKELAKVSDIAKKANRPELLRQLVEAFYVAGNRVAGSYSLSELNNLEPQLFNEVRLLEEFYGFRKWEQVNKLLSTLEKRSMTDLPKRAEEAKEANAIMRRFIVQVDAEKEMATDLTPYLKRSIDIYLTLYPNDDLRVKMQEGWLSTETDKNAKIAKISNWIKAGLVNKISSDDIAKLRRTRLSLAQQVKNSPVIIEESTELAKLFDGKKDAEEFNYVLARELYEIKNYDKALVHFQMVVNEIEKNKTISKNAILAENLILDIYNTRKNFDGIIGEVSRWNRMTANIALNEELKKENDSLKLILMEARFEKAMLQKETPEALVTFSDICQEGYLIEKSCANAKILSVKYKDQARLVMALEKMKDYQGLASELELMGRFNDAAVVTENQLLKNNPDSEMYLKTALLYELDQKNVERDRILKSLVESLKGTKSIDPNLEKLLFLTLDEAKLIDEKTLSLPWSTPFKLKVASRMSLTNSSDTTSKILLSNNAEGEGPLWSKAILKAVNDEFNKLEKIKFYGSQSAVLFKKRTNAVEKFSKMVKPILENADIETRIYLIQYLKLTYKNLANEILNTPIPEGLDEKTMAIVAEKVATMADPFDKVNEDYDRLLNEQLNAVTDASFKEKISNNLKASTNYAQFINADSSLDLAMDDSRFMEIKPSRDLLLKDPENQMALNNLLNFYSKNKQTRLEAYFKGRIENLKEVRQ